VNSKSLKFYAFLLPCKKKLLSTSFGLSKVLLNKVKSTSFLPSISAN
jgi:hypothetical protein